uniref:EamA family transporter n=1 Tax=Rufibacter psychrotolerans TaxID=2812556 RepID=UPI001968797F
MFTVYGQLVLKWRISKLGALPELTSEKFLFIAKFFLDPFILSGFASAFIASIFWMAAMTKFEISFAYPFMSLSFILVLFLSTIFLGEAFTMGKALGLLLIVAGIVVTVKF